MNYLKLITEANEHRDIIKGIYERTGMKLDWDALRDAYLAGMDRGITDVERGDRGPCLACSDPWRRFGFCQKHFADFKGGFINKDGTAKVTK